jgi:hypothetical protein
MAVIEGGTSGALAEVGAAAAKGQHVIQKYHDYGSLGHYRTVFTTGTIAAGMAANGELLQMRWVDATRFCVITKVEILQFRNITTAFAAGVYNFEAIRATAWSADGTGGTAVTVTDPAFQLRPPLMGASLFSTGFRIATTAALGAGTKTLDAGGPMGACYGNVGSTPAIAEFFIPKGGGVTGVGGSGVPIFEFDADNGEHPLVLTAPTTGTAEGLVVRATVPATGTWIASIGVRWMELAAF